MVRMVSVGIGVLAVLFLVVGLMLPSSLRLERSIVISAPQANVYSLVASLKMFNVWSPWAERDPQAIYSYSGPERGIGAKMTWVSARDDVGGGSQLITDARPSHLIRTRLTFKDAGEADASFALSSDEGGTRLTWRLEVDLGMSLIRRYLGLFIGSSLGDDYEQGLINLKALAESLPQADIASLDVGIEAVEGHEILYVQTSAGDLSANPVAAIDQALTTLSTFLSAHEIEVAGPPLTLNRQISKGADSFDVGVPVTLLPEKIEAGLADVIQVGRTYEGRVLLAVHTGPYAGLRDTYDQIEAYIALNGFKVAGTPWEEYVSDYFGDQRLADESELVTWIYYPVEK